MNYKEKLEILDNSKSAFEVSLYNKGYRVSAVSNLEDMIEKEWRRGKSIVKVRQPK